MLGVCTLKSIVVNTLNKQQLVTCIVVFVSNLNLNHIKLRLHLVCDVEAMYVYITSREEP